MTYFGILIGPFAVGLNLGRASKYVPRVGGSRPGPAGLAIFLTRDEHCTLVGVFRT